ncbi:hypothetical protein AB1K89_01000 [Sporosarcina sp. 179-K 8C2 HS]|uniref:hypothetical protein n=1 Tax=Sporosarcina sp. 179-K 8C2 HS TaxID=3142387 RepID=UPI0039A204D0
MNETTYHFSLNYNINHLGTEVIETRTIKREYKSDTSNSLQYLKSDMKTYSVDEADERIVEMLVPESSLGLSKKITSDQFEMFMYKYYDLFSVDIAELKLG